MIVDFSPRAGGKTTRLIMWLREDERRLLIVINNGEENRLKREYPDVSHRIVDWESYRHTRLKGSRFFDECAIDNADIILQGLVGEHLNRITISEN